MADPTHLLDPVVLSRLMAQPMLSRFAMEGNISGHHKSPHRGSSVEFAEYRNYAPGDDLKRLDWRVFARTDRFYMKEFEAETNLRCYVVLDCSGSMAFTGQHGSKVDLAKRVAATLAYITVHQGDAAGLVTIGEKTHQEIPPRRNPAHLQLILKMLDQTRARGQTGLIDTLHELAEKVRRRALIIIISDFFCDTEGLLNCLQHLRFRKHDLVLFHVMDPMELEFDFKQPIRFVDLESSFSLVTEPSIVRGEYLKQLGTFLERLRTGSNEFNAEYRRLTTDSNYEQVLADFLSDRARLS